jgi:hypothetical protein
MSPDIYQATYIKYGLRHYLRHHKPINCTCTPTHMMRIASLITGVTFKPRDYTGAILALDRYLRRLGQYE